MKHSTLLPQVFQTTAIIACYLYSLSSAIAVNAASSPDEVPDLPPMPDMTELNRMHDMLMKDDVANGGSGSMLGYDGLGLQLDETESCNKLAGHGKCKYDEVKQVCAKSCRKFEEHLKSKMKTDAVTVDVDGDEEIFFDLKANMYLEGNKEISFERFEGYLTVVANLGKICHTDGVDHALTHLVSLFNIVPYSLNVVVFPFPHPFLDYKDHESEFNCDETYTKVLEKFATDKNFMNRLYIMEELKLLNDYEGDSDEEKSKGSSQVHPVYQYLKSKFNMQDLLVDYATFFFVSSEGDRIDLLQGSSFEGVKDWVRQLTKKNYNEL